MGTPPEDWLTEAMAADDALYGKRVEAIDGHFVIRCRQQREDGRWCPYQATHGPGTSPIVCWTHAGEWPRVPPAPLGFDLESIDEDAPIPVDSVPACACPAKEDDPGYDDPSCPRHGSPSSSDGS